MSSRVGFKVEEGAGKTKLTGADRIRPLRHKVHDPWNLEKIAQNQGLNEFLHKLSRLKGN